MIISSDLRSARTALVVYGTETGTAQDLAYEASRILERHHFEADVAELDDTSSQSLAQYAIVVFVLSTTGQGDFPVNARKFWNSLLKKRLASTFLAGVEYALVGLGDSSYPKFNWAARKLEKRVRQLGAESLLDACEADEQGEDSTDGAFILWSQTFISMLQEKYPLPVDILPVPHDRPLKSKWLLSAAEMKGFANQSTDSPNSGHEYVNGTLRSPDKILSVTLRENKRITPPDHWQDVRFLKLEFQDRVDYHPGDAIAIRPKNLPIDVNRVLKLMYWEESADKLLCCQLQRKTSGSQRPPDPSLTNMPSFTLRQLLTENLDINAIPRRSFFSKIAQYTNDEMHKTRLLEFTDPQYLDEYYDYATRPRRSILEILQEFDSVKIPWPEAINVFPILRPRQFSVASGGIQKDGGVTVELLVAIVKYKTVIKRIREGVCSKYLAQLPVGTSFDVVLKTEGRFHHGQGQLGMTSHLLIGAGTGVAPLRALIQEMAMLGGSGSPAMLVFGCRNASADYFFKDEWRELIDSRYDPGAPFLQVITAFSRDQQQKCYVQDRIREHSDMIKHLLLEKEATIIVCGSSGAMPKAIRQAFIDVLKNDDAESNKTYTDEAAEAFLIELEKAGRYKQETW